MVVSLRVSPAAVADLEAVADYLGQRNPVAAIRFVEAAQATFEYITDAPLAYPKLESTTQALVEMRMRVLTGAFRRYVVFYRVGDKGIAWHKKA